MIPRAVVLTGPFGLRRDMLARSCVGLLEPCGAVPAQFVAAAGIHPGALVTGEPDSPHHDLAAVRGEFYFAFAEGAAEYHFERTLDLWRRNLAGESRS